MTARIFNTGSMFEGFQGSGGGGFPGPDIISGAGDFASSAGWTLTGGASIAAGTLAMNGTGLGKALRTAAVTIVPGTYRVTFDIISTDGGDSVLVNVGGAGAIVGGSVVPGSFSKDIVTAAANQNCFIQDDSTVCVIDNLVIKQIA